MTEVERRYLLRQLVTKVSKLQEQLTTIAELSKAVDNDPDLVEWCQVTDYEAEQYRLQYLNQILETRQVQHG